MDLVLVIGCGFAVVAFVILVAGAGIAKEVKNTRGDLNYAFFHITDWINRESKK